MDAAATILVMDDEPEIAAVMRDFLEAKGFRVLTAGSGEEALALLGREAVDCLLLDILLPVVSGFEVCRQVRRQRDLSIVFLSARDGDTDKIRGLGPGGDEYVVKSASLGEIAARIRAVLRRGTGPNQASGLLDFGRLVIDLRAHEVRVEGRPVPFTARSSNSSAFWPPTPGRSSPGTRSLSGSWAVTGTGIR